MDSLQHYINTVFSSFPGSYVQRGSINLHWSLSSTKRCHISDEGRNFVADVAPVVMHQSAMKMFVF